MPSPWHYSNERDMRTFKDMALGLLGPSAIDAVAAVPRPKIEHDALEDAVYQVRVVQTLAAGLRALRKAAPTPKSEEEFP
jgi:hypothetical protein